MTEAIGANLVAPARRHTLWLWFGVLLALGGPSILVIWRKLYPRPEFLQQREIGFLVFWGLVAAVLGIVVFIERKPLASIGLGRFTWGSLLWGLGVGIAAILLYPACAALAKVLNLPDQSASTTALASVAALPLAVRLLSLLTAGVTEEILFRGYPIRKLRDLTGSRIVAVVIPWAVFTVLHTPSWGLSHLLFVGATAALFTVVFLWRGDLWTNIIAHLVTDTVPLILLPLLPHAHR